MRVVVSFKESKTEGEISEESGVYAKKSKRILKRPEGRVILVSLMPSGYTDRFETIEGVNSSAAVAINSPCRH
jgi:hypothetical protein